MKNFDMRRFGSLLKFDLVQNARSYAAFAVGALLAHLLGQIGIFCMFHHVSGSVSWRAATALDDGVGLFFVTTFFVLLVGVSMTFDVLSTKLKRTDYLLLPASRAEKFVSRLLILTVGVWLMNALVFCLADVLRMLFFSCWAWIDGSASVSIPSCIPAVWRWTVDGMSELGHVAVGVSVQGQNLSSFDMGVMCSTLAVYAFYLLGSIVFRRRAFIYTSLVRVVLLFAGLKLLSCVKTALYFCWPELRAEADTWLAVWSVGSLLMAGLFVWTAWRIFCRTGLVRRKLR